jgi:hypothetical protein
MDFLAPVETDLLAGCAVDAARGEGLVARSASEVAVAEVGLSPLEGDDLAVVDEAVNHGGGDDVVAEGLAPGRRPHLRLAAVRSAGSGRAGAAARAARGVLATRLRTCGAAVV